MPINLSFFDVDDKQKAMIIGQFEDKNLYKLSFKNKLSLQLKRGNLFNR